MAWGEHVDLGVGSGKGVKGLMFVLGTGARILGDVCSWEQSEEASTMLPTHPTVDKIMLLHYVTHVPKASLLPPKTSVCWPARESRKPNKV